MLNPVEECFSKIKLFVQIDLADPTNHENLTDLIEQSVANVTATIIA